ncbi:MAG: hypothetical protein WAK82_00070 [Streptosporangiaceae bacterium]
MTLRGADLIAYYLSADWLRVHRQWSRKHAHTQRRLRERFAVPVIAGLRCDDITVRHMQQVVNAASTPGEGGRVRGMVSAGLEGGYLANARLAQVHWQAGDRAAPAAGELRGRVGVLGRPGRGARRSRRGRAGPGAGLGVARRPRRADGHHQAYGVTPSRTLRED